MKKRLLTGVFGLVASTIPFITNLGALIESPDPYEFPDQDILSPSEASAQSKRLLNPLWAPTAYLQGIDCLSSDYEVKSLDGAVHDFEEYKIHDQNIINEANDSSLSYSVHINHEGHAIILLKAMSLPLEHDKHEKAVSGTYHDIMSRDEQITALDLVIEHLQAHPDIETIESVGFAQGSEGVYHLAEKYNIVGTIVSDTGTQYDTAKLSKLVISLDVPGDIHFTMTTGAHKPATEIDLGDAVQLDWSKALTPLQTSWVEHIQTLAFKMDEAQAPLGYEGQGTKLIQELVGNDKVCNNPTMNLDKK